MALPDPALEEGIKALVKAFANAAKHMTAASVPHLNFMATCITEILSVDPIVSYALAFSYIKQVRDRLASLYIRPFLALAVPCPVVFPPAPLILATTS